MPYHLLGILILIAIEFLVLIPVLLWERRKRRRRISVAKYQFRHAYQDWRNHQNPQDLEAASYWSREITRRQAA